MKIDLFNNVGTGIKYAISDTIDPNVAKFNFKNFPHKKSIKFNANDRYFALKVPKDEGFSFTAKSRILFEFIQVVPKDPDQDFHDIYLFQVTKLGKVSANLTGGGGDGDMDPPNPNFPFVDNES